MQIVVPLRRVADRPPACRRRRRASFASFSSIRCTGRSAMRRRTVCGQFGQDVGVAVVDDRVHRIEAQPVEIVLLEPIERVLDHEVAHRAARVVVVIDRRAPRRVMALGEEIRAMTAGSYPRGRNGCRRRRAAPRGRARGTPRPAPSDPRAGHRRRRARRAARRHSPSCAAPETRAIGISSIAVTPSSTRSSRREIAPAKSPLSENVPRCSS